MSARNGSLKMKAGWNHFYAVKSPLKTKPDNYLSCGIEAVDVTLMILGLDIIH